MQVIVYAIAKDEALNVESFMQTVKDADGVYVLDTGSTDGTAKLLQDLGAIVTTHDFGRDFRFDVARNHSLSLVPRDQNLLCLYLDLDERLDTDWRAKLEAVYNPDCYEYRFYWYQNDSGNPFTFTNIRCHNRFTHTWDYPVHEVLVPKHPIPPYIHTGIYVTHVPQPKQRTYLPLLEIAYSERPNDPRVLHYLGREYMYQQEQYYTQLAVSTFLRYTQLPKRMLWDAELSQVHMYMARCYAELGQYFVAEQNYFSAIAAFPTMREPYLELARYYVECGEYESALGMVAAALRITELPKTYLYYEYNAWRAEPYSIGARCYTELNLMDKAKEYLLKALSFGNSPELVLNYFQLFNEIPAGCGLTLTSS